MEQIANWAFVASVLVTLVAWFARRVVLVVGVVILVLGAVMLGALFLSGPAEGDSEQLGAVFVFLAALCAIAAGAAIALVALLLRVARRFPVVSCIALITMSASLGAIAWATMDRDPDQCGLVGCDVISPLAVAFAAWSALMAFVMGGIALYRSSRDLSLRATEVVVPHAVDKTAERIEVDVEDVPSSSPYRVVKRKAQTPEPAGVGQATTPPTPR